MQKRKFYFSSGSSFLAVLFFAGAFLAASPVFFAAFSFLWPTLFYLHAAGFSLLLTLGLMFLCGAVCPRLAEPVTFASATKLDMTPSKGAFCAGLLVVAATVALYVVFW